MSFPMVHTMSLNFFEVLQPSKFPKKKRQSLDYIVTCDYSELDENCRYRKDWEN